MRPSGPWVTFWHRTECSLLRPDAEIRGLQAACEEVDMVFLACAAKYRKNRELAYSQTTASGKLRRHVSPTGLPEQPKEAPFIGTG